MDGHFSDSDSDDSVHEILMISSDSESDNEVVFDEISDLEDAPMADMDTPPLSPGMVQPYVDPENSHLPDLISSWKHSMHWPQIEYPPFDQRDFPLTHEPPHHTVPLLVARIHELEGKIDSLEDDVTNLATQRSVAITRDSLRDLRENLTEYIHIFNNNARILDTVRNRQENIIEGVNDNIRVEIENTDFMSTKILQLEDRIKDLETQLPSTSGNKRPRDDKTP